MPARPAECACPVERASCVQGARRQVISVAALARPSRAQPVSSAHSHPRRVRCGHWRLSFTAVHVVCATPWIRCESCVRVWVCLQRRWEEGWRWRRVRRGISSTGAARNKLDPLESVMIGGPTGRSGRTSLPGGAKESIGSSWGVGQAQRQQPGRAAEETGGGVWPRWAAAGGRGQRFL